MLISPPFLPARGNNESEADWLSRCMAGGAPGEGAFPVSFNFGWHGGMHLTAPRNGASVEAVRAVADGVVVYRRDPTPRPAGDVPDTHPQAYRGGWTDNGVVVVRHDTEIGEGANAAVLFFSIYMHLSAIEAAVSTSVRGGRIFRKAEIGHAGQIYGSGDRRIHFEIVCDSANLRRLVGRANGDIGLGVDGRTDAVYGTIYVHLPAGTPVYSQEPLPTSVIAMAPPSPSPGHPRPAPVALQAVHTTGMSLFIALRAAGGEDAANQRGSIFVGSYRLDGSMMGTELEEVSGEYDLYSRSKSISEAYPANGRPAAAAVYELLRFGRVIGPDALSPADVPCWRQVRNDGGGVGWVNLNAVGLQKFSDADFPHWRGWRLVDDSADRDSRCDSALIRSWLDTDGDGKITPAEATTRSANPEVEPKLARAICQFTTEWDAATMDRQWGWLKAVTDENPRPLSADDFERLRAHLTALQFWPGGTGLANAHWHFQPREFIRHFRKCGWRSRTELASTFPRHLFYTTSGTRTAITAPAAIYSLSQATASTRIQDHSRDLNWAMRKYCVDTPQRQAHFLAQVMLETAQWRNMPPNRLLMHEWGFGTYSVANPMTQYYTGFYGRGIMQLTWVSNYRDYGVFRGGGLPDHAGAYIERLALGHPRTTQTSVHWTGNPAEGAVQIVWSPRYDPDVIATDAFNACDSGAFYWVSKHHSGVININRVCDREFNPATVGRVSVLVNGGGNGYYERQAYAAYIFRYLSDSVGTADEVELQPPAPKARVRASFLKPT